ncbi:zinc ribbon domain-containing protein [candidate division WOR-3 bacterium]|nr:zinc ribbon domain-containing protein [candidate division WOR-3 bacterium]
MPVYEYRCKKCGKVTEIFQKSLTSNEPAICSHCGSTNLMRLISAPTMVRVGDSSPKGTTCCGRTERCDTPPCSDDGVCRRDR